MGKSSKWWSISTQRHCKICHPYRNLWTRFPFMNSRASQEDDKHTITKKCRLKIPSPSKMEKFRKATYFKPHNYHDSWNTCGKIQQTAITSNKSNWMTWRIKTAQPKLSPQSTNRNRLLGTVFLLLYLSFLILVMLSLHRRIRCK